MDTQLVKNVQLIIITLFLCGMITESNAIEDDPGVGSGGVVNVISGTWVASGDFGQVSAGCVQAWSCEATGDIFTSPESTITYTEDESTWGACTIGGSTDPESCGACTANPPATPCELVIVGES